MARPTTEKARYRLELRGRLALLTPEKLARASVQLCENVQSLSAWQTAAAVGVFHGQAKLAEPSLDGLFAARGHRRIAYPRVLDAGRMDFCWVEDPAELVPDEIVLPGGRAFTMSQPIRGLPAINPAELDLILVPGAAFTRDGHRLGRGGGFYDRYLAQPGLRAVKLGVALECQLVETLPLDPHDVVMDGVVTA
jgi:5-formyltetrahydrofolate cyclo-ligase